MSFDFSALITDRTQEDVTKKTTKGFYNASDLNRVTACMEYLDEELRRLGYESGYKPVVVHPQEEGGSGLPDGYTELEYIESTGTQKVFHGSSGSSQFLAGPEITPEPQPEPLDPYTWYDTDCPTLSQLQQYLDNVAAMRAVFDVGEFAPDAPKIARFFTFYSANDIEKILDYVEKIITRIKSTINLGWALGVAHIGIYGGQ